MWKFDYSFINIIRVIMIKIKKIIYMYNNYGDTQNCADMNLSIFYNILFI